MSKDGSLSVHSHGCVWLEHCVCVCVVQQQQLVNVHVRGVLLPLSGSFKLRLIYSRFFFYYIFFPSSLIPTLLSVNLFRFVSQSNVGSVCVCVS